MKNNNQTTGALPSPPTKTPWIDSEGNLLKASKDWVNHVYQAISFQQSTSNNFASSSFQSPALAILAYLRANAGVAPTPVNLPIYNIPIVSGVAYIDLSNGFTQKLTLPDDGSVVTVNAPTYSGGTIYTGLSFWLFIDTPTTGTWNTPLFESGSTGQFSSYVNIAYVTSPAEGTRDKLEFDFDPEDVWALKAIFTGWKI